MDSLVVGASGRTTPGGGGVERRLTAMQAVYHAVCGFLTDGETGAGPVRASALRLLMSSTLRNRQPHETSNAAGAYRNTRAAPPAFALTHFVCAGAGERPGAASGRRRLD